MTEPAATPRRPTKRKRPHPAAAGRVLVAGAATAGTLAMAGLMARPVDQPAGAEPAASTALTPVSVRDASDATAAPGPTRIVVVRRHHPAPSSGSVVRTSPVVTPAPSAPAPPVRPAPRPAPVRTKSSGS